MDGSQTPSSQPYQLTVKRGFLALFVMYVSQTLVGLGFAYGVRTCFENQFSAFASRRDIRLIMAM